MEQHDHGVFGDLWNHPFASRRSATVAMRGMVATSQSLAAQAGLSVLERGGNAVDAAIATAAALTVVEPTSNGLGSDAFALVWDGQQVHGLNGSGRWPQAADLSAVTPDAHGGFPSRGWQPVTVPGAIDAWGALHDRFGVLDRAEVLAPAIALAVQGHPVSPVAAVFWAKAAASFPKLGLPGTEQWSSVFAPNGRAPRPGERWVAPGHGRTLRAIADNGWRDAYEGSVARAIVDWSERTGGWLSEGDLAHHEAEWVDPITTRYRDVDVWEIPPNGQGIAALMALAMYDEAVAPSSASRAGESDLLPSAELWHHQIEAMKLAFADSDLHTADPQHADVPVQEMLDRKRLAGRAASIGPAAGPPPGGAPAGSDTIYLSTADESGMMVSFIQSNFAGFGSGVVVPSHGFALQNRGAGFSLEPGHPNMAAPGKRPRHTIIPGFLTRNGEAIGPFGVMGGEMQPQGHLQVVASMVDHGLNPQAALDAPRWRVERNGDVLVEPQTPESVVAELRRRGHTVHVTADGSPFGRGQIIVRDEHGVMVGGTEPRADGVVAAR